MSCSRFHFLLSLNLDGRLSSARRESLLDHLAECSACAHLADEMREAQQLALSLPHERISSGFHESLWERIQAGEGSPEATFHEPVPLTTRLRYVATGAAAAALFLVALNSIAPTEPEQPADTIGQPRTETVASAAPVADSLRPAAVPSTGRTLAQRVRLQANPINPTNVAQVAQQITIENVNYLQSRARDLEDQLQVAHAPAIRATLDEPLRELQSATHLMQWMSGEDFIHLSPDTEAELRVADRIFPMLQKAQDAESIRSALALLRDLNTANFSRRFSVVCCDTQQDFLDRFRDQIL
ncbi:MAG: zf-HC2 domain-containing protein, partial [Planctomycetes bacterium]|nr:zf-HC2 domain-containing protein [Planctomycetota bacterium]